MPKAREGESTRGGVTPPLISGVLGPPPPPPKKILHFERFYARLMGFYALGPDFSPFGHGFWVEKRFLVA